MQAQAAAAKAIQDHLVALVVDDPGAREWPWRIPIGRPAAEELNTDWKRVRDLALDWRRLEPRQGTTLDWVNRRVSGIPQTLPAGITFDTLDAAAAFAGPATIAAVALARRRWSALKGRFPTTATPATLQTVISWDIVNFRLALDTAEWFRTNPTPDDTWTPRMVPVPGLHAKWLDLKSRRQLVAVLAGIPHITLRDRPAQAHITYLDPTWLANGGRRFDIITAGDPHSLPYRPQIVIITENRDTALYFPAMSAGIAVRGDGDRVLRSLPDSLLIRAPQVVYWGDVDVDGLEIVDGLRDRGAKLRTILMDLPSYDTYRQFGTHTDQAGRPLGVPERKALRHLSEAERGLYERLTDPGWEGPRRIEQERIPLTVAAGLLS